MTDNIEFPIVRSGPNCHLSKYLTIRVLNLKIICEVLTLGVLKNCCVAKVNMSQILCDIAKENLSHSNKMEMDKIGTDLTNFQHDKPENDKIKKQGFFTVYGLIWS